MGLRVAFLRGMNLGGRRISNADLRAEFEALGFEEVTTFRASGNVIFESNVRAEAELVAEIEAGLHAALGYSVPTFLRTEAEMREIAIREPFEPSRVKASEGKHQVSILSRQPSDAQRRKVLAMATDADPLVVEGREVHWLPSGGLLESELDLDAIEELVGPSTRRTMGTIEGIVAKLPSRDG